MLRSITTTLVLVALVAAALPVAHAGPPSVPGPCTPGTEYYPGMSVETKPDCSLQVDVKSYDCVWNCRWTTLVDTPAVTVRHYGQSTGQDMARVDIPIDPCPIVDTPSPVDAFIDIEMDKNPCLDTEVTVGRAVACTPPIHGNTRAEYGRVTVLVPGCGIPVGLKAAGPSACGLRDSTPAAIKDGVWGKYDERSPDGECDIDVEPVGACTGGGGSQWERRISALHVKLLVCGMPGGPPIASSAQEPAAGDACLGPVVEEDVQPARRTGVGATVGASASGDPLACTEITITSPSFPGFACIRPGGPYTVFTVGPVTWQTYCGGGSTTTASNAVPPCTGFWYGSNSYSAAGLTISYGTNLQADCTHVRAQYSDVDCTFTASVRPDCKETVYEPFMCVGGASGYRDVATPIGLTLRMYTCSPPPGSTPGPTS